MEKALSVKKVRSKYKDKFVCNTDKINKDKGLNKFVTAIPNPNKVNSKKVFNEIVHFGAEEIDKSLDPKSSTRSFIRKKP